MTRRDRERAAWSLRSAIQVVAREVFGAQMVTRHVPGLSTPLQDVEPIAGVRAAVFARDVAAAAVRQYAKQARGAGHSWDDIAQGLGLDRVNGPRTRAQRAYLHLAAAHWRCTSCGALVTDRGPFKAAPDANEKGHATGCARHAAEMATYRQGNDQ